MKEFYRRHLPHYHPRDAIFFITFRLVNSLPQYIIERLKNKYKIEKELLTRLKNNPSKRNTPVAFAKRYFAIFHNFLDNQKEKNCWLKDERVAQIVADTIHYRDGKVYDLICYSIMPNHVHMVVHVGRSGTSTNNNFIKILQSLKSYTAKEANHLLGRTGQFWQNESYDRVVRNEEELDKVIRYVMNNPVKAGLVKDPRYWKFSYCKYKF
ncbi:MAG TPA: transposase [Bacteroidota bacterium]|nr:transposase [Bacteroidota bacterium]